MAMQPASAEFLAETGMQIASLSAFLGGFAATFFGILLQSSNSRRHVGWAAGAAAVASASFILAVISGNYSGTCAAPWSATWRGKANLHTTGPDAHTDCIYLRDLLDFA